MNKIILYRKFKYSKLIKEDFIKILIERIKKDRIYILQIKVINGESLD